MSTQFRQTRYKVRVSLQNDILPSTEELPTYDDDDYFFLRFMVHKCIKNFVYSDDQPGWQFYNRTHESIQSDCSFVIQPKWLLEKDLAYSNIASMLQRLNIPWRRDLVRAMHKIYRFAVSTERDFSKRPEGRKHMPILVDITMLTFQAITLEDEGEDEVTAQISSLSMGDYEVKSMPASKESIEALEKVRIDEGLLVSPEICAICYEEFSAGVEVACMPCTHLYHRECIAQWLARSYLCPLCRFEMPVAPTDD